MWWIKVALVIVLLCTSCGTTYTYYTLDSLDEVNWVTEADARMNKGNPPTRCIGAYPDSTGHTVYLMETRNGYE